MSCVISTHIIGTLLGTSLGVDLVMQDVVKWGLQLGSYLTVTVLDNGREAQNFGTQLGVTI